MSKILTIILFSFFFLYGCGEDCPVNTDERIIKLEEPCLEYEENIEYVKYIMSYRYLLGIKLEENEIKDFDKSFKVFLLFRSAERNPFSNIKFRIKTKTDEFIEINCDEELITKRATDYGSIGYYKSQNDQYSPFMTQYNIKKIVLLDDVEFEISYYFLYYFTKNEYNGAKLVVEQLQLEFKATDKELENNRKKLIEVTNKYFDNEYNYIDILYTYKVCK